MLPGESDCDDCRPGGGGGVLAPAAAVFSSLPFVLTFLAVATLVIQKLFPLLSGEATSIKASNYAQPFSSTRPTAKRLSALVFSSTIALAAVLAELILCEISNTIHPIARARAIRFVVSLLLFSLIVAIPFLEIHSIIATAGYTFTGPANSRVRLAWALQLLTFTAWLVGFWWSGNVLLGRHSGEKPILENDTQGIVEACLERIGVIGISVMSLLSGFASVSSPWHSFFARQKPVSPASIARKAAGLQATQDMLATKRSRLRALERKLSEAPSESLLQKALGSFRGGPNDHTERQTLLLEISGLETMALSLSASHANLETRHGQQVRAQTAAGRLVQAGSYGFAIFCLYRITTTSLTFIRRVVHHKSSPSSGFTTSDPVDNILALLAKHYDAHLDHATWTRSISFALSGLILAGSFGSVMQTFQLFSRFAPALLRTLQANLALVVAQVCAIYVISATLMLRGMMPGAVLGEGLGSIGPGAGGSSGTTWIDGWFEKWFLAGVGVTALGIWIGRRVSQMGYEYDEEWEDDDDDGVVNGALEMGKRS